MFVVENERSLCTRLDTFPVLKNLALKRFWFLIPTLKGAIVFDDSLGTLAIVRLQISSLRYLQPEIFKSSRYWLRFHRISISILLFVLIRLVLLSWWYNTIGIARQRSKRKSNLIRNVLDLVDSES